MWYEEEQSACHRGLSLIKANEWIDLRPRT
jgi:hypothetical protein